MANDLMSTPEHELFRLRESMAGRAFVDARSISIGGGSDETMMQYLAKQLGL